MVTYLQNWYLQIAIAVLSCF